MKPYYKVLCSFYKKIDQEYSKYCFHEFEKLPTDGNGDCKACDRNKEIDFYLREDNLEMANKLAIDIENFTLTCRETGGNESRMRMKALYLEYYMQKKDFGTAEKYIRKIEKMRGNNKKSEYEYWDKYLCCYSHTDIGKALEIYKKHWREWYAERCPDTIFYNDATISLFFKMLTRARKGDTVKLNLERFSLYVNQESIKYQNWVF